MQAHPQTWPIWSDQAHVSKRQLLLIVGLLFFAITGTIAIRVTWLRFFQSKSATPAIELVGKWKQEQPLGDASGSAGWNRWFYTFTADGRFKVRAEKKVSGNALQDLQIDSTGRWTLDKGKLTMTF